MNTYIHHRAYMHAMALQCWVDKHLTLAGNRNVTLVTFPKLGRIDSIPEKSVPPRRNLRGKQNVNVLRWGTSIRSGIRPPWEIPGNQRIDFVLQPSPRSVPERPWVAQVSSQTCLGFKLESTRFLLGASEVIFSPKKSRRWSFHRTRLCIMFSMYKHDPRPHRNRPKFHFVAVLVPGHPFCRLVYSRCRPHTMQERKQKSICAPRPSKRDPKIIKHL
jgi:hypothetical protein